MEHYLVRGLRFKGLRVLGMNCYEIVFGETFASFSVLIPLLCVFSI